MADKHGPGSVKPTVVIVPGAWHTGPGHCTDVASYLMDEFGHDTVVCTLQSVESDCAHEADVKADAAHLREQTLLPLLKAGKEILLLMHSFGGVPGSAAAAGLSKRSRQASGQSGGIVGLVYLAAGLLREGESMKAGRNWASWISVDEEAGQLIIGAVGEVFYSDLSNEAAAQATLNLRPQSIRSFTSPSPRPAWQDEAFRESLAYIICTKDMCVPPAVQRAIMDRTGASWLVRELEAGHCAFLSCPKQLATVVSQLAMAFTNDSAPGNAI